MIAIVLYCIYFFEADAITKKVYSFLFDFMYCFSSVSVSAEYLVENKCGYSENSTGLQKKVPVAVLSQTFKLTNILVLVINSVLPSNRAPLCHSFCPLIRESIGNLDFRFLDSERPTVCF